MEFTAITKNIGSQNSLSSSLLHLTYCYLC